jgi:uncharacterized protein (TIGR02996 family)
MNLEESFLHDIQAHPEDDACRLIYADWLEEQGDETSLTKAGFLRLEAALATYAPEDPSRQELLDRLGVLRPELATEWLATLSRVPVEHCQGLRFKLRCPQKWEHLDRIDAECVRFCPSCQKGVYYCTSVGEAKAHALRGRCVALELGVPRTPGDLDLPGEEPEELMFLGGFVDGGSTEEREAADRRPFWRRWLRW